MKKTLALILTFIMVLALVPTVAFAAGEVAWIGETGYATLEAAVTAAESGATITLGEGKYTLYGVSSVNTTKGKNLTFVGQGADKTFWGIGATMPDPANFGTEYNGDYSFDGAGTITFRNMTLQSGAADYLGFIRADKTIVENCTVNGKTFYWGYTSATFTKTTFNCPAGDYAVWTYSSPTMTFESCTFNSTGKVINVYTDYSAGKHNITVNFNNCTVINTDESLKPVLNINDYNMGNYKYILNITGDNKVTGVDVDKITCSRLFGFGGKAENNTGRSDVTINGVKVWEGGKRVCAHNGVVFTTGSYNGDVTTQYTDGYKDNAFTVTPKPNVPGSFEVKCIHCGYTETSTGGLYNDIGLARTVKQNNGVVSEDSPSSNKYKVANTSGITVDYTATMNMENLKWLVAGKEVDVSKLQNVPDGVTTPWELLMARPGQITEDTVVFLKFTFDKNIDLKEFENKYNTAKMTADKEKLLKLTSDMFEMTGVAFGTDNTMTITCKWKLRTITDTPNSTITLKGCGLPVKDNWGGSKIDITNSGCVKGMVHINPMGGAVAAMVEPGSNVAANVQVQNTTPPEISPTIQIPIVGGCKTDEFTLYYGGGSSDDSSGDSGHSHYYPTTTPVPVIVIPPKTGDMTVWQSILHFLGIK
ncbi:MAG: hypothetical protein U0M40_03880 [Christensenellales bacterium]